MRITGYKKVGEEKAATGEELTIYVNLTDGGYCVRVCGDDVADNAKYFGANLAELRNKVAVLLRNFHNDSYKPIIVIEEGGRFNGDALPGHKRYFMLESNGEVAYREFMDSQLLPGKGSYESVDNEWGGVPGRIKDHPFSKAAVVIPYTKQKWVALEVIRTEWDRIRTDISKLLLDREKVENVLERGSVIKMLADGKE